MTNGPVSAQHRGTYRRLLPFLRPHLGRLFGAVACNMTAAVLDAFTITLLIPFLNALFRQPPLPTRGGWLTALLRNTIGRLLDPADPMSSLLRVIAIILAAVVVKNLLAWIAGQLGAQLQEYVTRDLRNATYRHLQRLPLSYFTKTKVGQILARILTDTASTRQVLTQVVTQGLQAGTKVIATVVALLGISASLTGISVTVAALLMGSLQPLLRKLRRRHRRLGNEYGEITSVVQETVSGVRLVKSFRAESHEEQRFVAASDRYARGMARVSRLAALAAPLTETVGMLVAVVVLWIGARQVLVTHALDGAQLITFLGLVLSLLQPLKQLTSIQTTMQASLAAADRLFEILDTPTEPTTDRGTKPASFRDSIAFEKVSFAYDDAPVLEDISLTARRGDVIALVGPSGAGKTTLVDLIPRFYEPTAGRVLLDGVDTREIRLADLRGLIAVVSQDTVLFNDTVRANIAYGATGFDDAQIMAAARAANAHDFITAMPKGYDTILGERGTRLSGGQRQRIAIARALLTDRPILVLDEATSALDTDSERLVQQAIDRLLEGRTVFVIAHRLSTVQHASQIIVLDRGRIVERGTHDELLARRGTYHRLHALQFRDGPAPMESDADSEGTMASTGGRPG